MFYYTGPSVLSLNRQYTVLKGSVPERHAPALCTQWLTHAGDGNLSTSPISVTTSSSNVKLTINLSETGSFKQNTPLNYYLTVNTFF